MVLATQNPIEHEGTYPLPEAQVDRFVMKLRVDYPNADEELRMLNLYLDPTAEPVTVHKVLQLDAIHEVARLAAAVHVDDRISATPSSSSRPRASRRSTASPPSLRT